MKRAALLVAVVAGLGLFGTGLRGVAEVDGRLSDGAERPAVEGVEVKQEIRAPGDCPGRRPREELPPRDELRL